MMRKMRLDYFNKSEQKSKFVTPDEVCEMIKSEKYRKSCDNIAYKLATIPDINPNSTMEDAERLPVIRFGLGEEDAYTGYVLLSFKTNDASTKDDIKQKAMELPQTLMVFEGCSRRSMKVVVAFSLPDGTLPPGRWDEEPSTDFHQKAFVMASKFYEGQLTNKPERKPPRTDRGCRISSDADIFVNNEVKPMVITLTGRQMTAPAAGGKSINMQTYVSKALPHYTALQMMMTNFQACYMNATHGQEDSDMDLFLESLARICQKSGIEEEFAIRRTLHKTPYRDCEVLVKGCFRNVYSKGSLGSESPIPDATLQMELMKDFFERHYKFRRNMITGENEYIDKGGFQFEWSPITAQLMNTITFEAITEGITVWDKDIKRFLNSTFVRDYDPVRDYMNALPPWDGVDRMRDFALRVPTDNKNWVENFHTWMLAMVSQWTGMHKIHGSTMVPLLVGGQGDGKSTFCKLILPEELRSYYTDRLDFANRNDAERALTRFCLINIDEFDSITKRQQAFLKHILQKSSVMSRQLYSSTVKEMTRKAAFIATTNDPTPLTDPSGSRRYLCIRTNGIIDTRSPIDYPQLYAQVKCELSAGYRSWFSSEEEEWIQAANREFQQFDQLEDIFKEMFHKPQTSEKGVWMTVSAILHLMKSVYKALKEDTSSFQKLGRIIKRHNFRNRKMHAGSEYYVAKNEKDS